MKLGVGEVTYEFIRKHCRALDKRLLLEEQVGFRYAEQSIRAIGRLHTMYGNHRGEMDNTKYGKWLFPNSKWSEPLFFHTGIGVDHSSGVIKGTSVTIAPSAASTIRLYRDCVLPKALTLPEPLRHLAHDWDVAGADAMVAVDNGPEMRNRSVGLMLLMLWVILLFMPPKRGDFKGTIERLVRTLETRYISTLPGYVNAGDLRGTDPRAKRIRESAKRKANMTVADYIGKLASYSIEHNHSRHPRFGRPRIEVYREALSLVPMLLPTGMRQIDAIFSLTYEATLTREGVEVEGFKYQSDELGLLFRVNAGKRKLKVHVKLPPDDVRKVFVYAPRVRDPIVAYLTTLDIDFPMTLELARTLASRVPEGVPPSEFGFHFLHQLEQLQSGATVLEPGEALSHIAQAAAHAADVPAVERPSSETESATDLDSLLEGTELADG